jgi:hypothetical protein
MACSAAQPVHLTGQHVLQDDTGCHWSPTATAHRGCYAVHLASATHGTRHMRLVLVEQCIGLCMHHLRSTPATASTCSASVEYRGKQPPRAPGVPCAWPSITLALVTAHTDHCIHCPSGMPASASGLQLDTHVHPAASFNKRPTYPCARRALPPT